LLRSSVIELPVIGTLIDYVEYQVRYFSVRDQSHGRAMTGMPRWSASAASADVVGLGEGPLWDAPRRRVLWVDINAGTVHEGRLDGTCDPTGAFLIGTLALDDSHGGESLVRVEGDETITVLDDDLNLSNGLAFSVDATLLYSVHSVPGVVWARSYDAATGAVGARREWLRITDGTPDGLCVDADGHLWIAIWGAGQVRRYTPDAQLAGIVEVAAPHTTSVAFVGDDLDLLLITTATADLTAEQLAAHPDSGRLFLARVGVTGLPVTAWAGPREGKTCT
jgi:sugar lactone lactonase YvrE